MPALAHPGCAPLEKTLSNNMDQHKVFERKNPVFPTRHALMVVWGLGYAAVHVVTRFSDPAVPGFSEGNA